MNPFTMVDHWWMMFMSRERHEVETVIEKDDVTVLKYLAVRISGKSCSEAYTGRARMARRMSNLLMGHMVKGGGDSSRRGTKTAYV